MASDIGAPENNPQGQPQEGDFGKRGRGGWLEQQHWVLSGKIQERAPHGRMPARGGGGRPRAYADIEEEFFRTMEPFEAEVKPISEFDDKFHHLEEMLRKTIENPRQADFKKFLDLHEALIAKHKMLEFYYHDWTGPVNKQGVHGVEDSIEVDNAVVFDRLLKDSLIAKEFGNLIETHDDPYPGAPGVTKSARYSLNDVARELEVLRRSRSGKSKAKDLEILKTMAAKRYAWMLYDAAGLHAEAASDSIPRGVSIPDEPDTKYPKFSDEQNEYLLKSLANFNAWIAWEGERLDVKPEWTAYWNRHAKQLDPHTGVDPIDTAAATINETNLAEINRVTDPGLPILSRRSTISNNLDVRTGEPATHAQILYLGNFLNKMIDWNGQPNEVKKVILANRRAIRRPGLSAAVAATSTDPRPRNLKELKGIDWTKVDLKPRTGSLKSNPYRRYIEDERTRAEKTILWFKTKFLEAQTNIFKGRPTEVMSEIRKVIDTIDEPVYKTFVASPRGVQEIRSLLSETLFTYIIPTYEQAGQFRNNEMMGRLMSYAAAGGDAERWFHLYGRDFHDKALQGKPISPYQAAFMLKRIYGRDIPLEATKGLSRPTRTTSKKLLNKAAENIKMFGGRGMNWQEVCAADGINQDFTDFIDEVELQGRTGRLDWEVTPETLAGELNNTGGSHRLKYLINNFGMNIAFYGLFQEDFFEEVVKNAVGYHQADENSIYEKHLQFEQYYGQLITGLRAYTEDGTGDRFLEFAAGRLANYNNNPHWKYEIPPNNTTANADLWLYPTVFRKVEKIMLHMSEGFSLNYEDYKKDPESNLPLPDVRQAVPSSWDRYLLLTLFFRENEMAHGFYGSEAMENFMERFHCTRNRVDIFRIISKQIFVKDPIGLKEEKKGEDGEKTGQKLLSEAVPFLGKVAALIPLPLRNLTEFLIAPGVLAFTASLAKIANVALRPWLGFAIPVGETIFGIAPIKDPIFNYFHIFNLSPIWFLSLYGVQRLGLMSLARFILSRKYFDNKWMGVRETRVSINQRYKDALINV